MKVAIVGAGPAGLFAALELRKEGIDFDIFEAHSKPGGCASYFRRQVGEEKILFDAGATVLWALDSQNEDNNFLRKKLLEWNIQAPTFYKSTFHRFSLHEKTFNLNTESEQHWIDSLKKEFPKDKNFLDEYFPVFFKIAKELNKALYKIPAEPFFEISALIKNLSLSKELIAILPYYLKWPHNFGELLSKNKISIELKEWIDMLLLITLQARSEDVESLYGATALSFFPLGAGTLDGGMFTLFDILSKSINSHKEKLHFRHKVLNIKEEKGYSLLVKAGDIQKTWGPYSAIFLSCPRWNSHELFKEEKIALFEELDPWESAQKELWSAVVAYVAIKDNPQMPAEAYNHQVKNGDQEFYFSISKRNDLLRGSQSLRTVTISTHEKLEEWQNFSDYQKKKDFDSKNRYLEKKLLWEKTFRDVTEKTFPQSLVFIDVGTPKTFGHYTQRKDGFVGGIPLTQKHTLLNSPSQRTLLPRVYQIGDTSFPGQSVVSCAIGALEAVRKFKKDS